MGRVTMTDQLAFPLARRSDPDTSHQAANLKQHTLGKDQQDVLDLIRRHPARTATELGAILREETIMALAREHADETVAHFATILADINVNRLYQLPNKRTPELHRLGLIEVLEERACEITGRQARTWRAL